ncbi:hypothetical protein E1200_06905 [Actinomadura sp. GC306]|uniref:hypothetical protein n=1 Tax=Actinomadura sp. GC306 TaxID=2530367 RepID=UPI001049FA4C|nr:hypothetical protein [Actinomadura sp. GC306]TDC69915.1 hypothetical protein E1200_06905 [Actinomadura sp. GC306]
MDRVRAIADVVLYEGHELWPSRRSTPSTGQRWTIDGVYPRPYAELVGDRWTACAEFLMEGSPEADVEVTLRFLHAVHRQAMDGDAPVDDVLAGGGIRETRREAREREITGGRVPVARLLRSPVRIPVAVAAGTDEEDLGGGARFLRLWHRVDGTVEVSAAAVGDGVVRLRVEVVNTGRAEDRDEAVQAGMMCAHVVVRARGAAFVSPGDPPERLAGAAAECASDGLWPVLAGAPGRYDTVLAAPVVLYDWPQVAPEGSVFDGTGAGRLLVRDVLGLGAQERRETAAAGEALMGGDAR